MRGCAAGEQLAGADAAGQGLGREAHSSPGSRPCADGTREQRLGLSGESSGGWQLEWNLRSCGLRRPWGRGQGSEFPLELTAVLTAQEAEGQEITRTVTHIHQARPRRSQAPKKARLHLPQWEQQGTLPTEGKRRPSIGFRKKPYRRGLGAGKAESPWTETVSQPPTKCSSGTSYRWHADEKK